MHSNEPGHLRSSAGSVVDDVVALLELALVHAQVGQLAEPALLCVRGGVDISNHKSVRINTDDEASRRLFLASS